IRLIDPNGMSVEHPENGILYTGKDAEEVFKVLLALFGQTKTTEEKDEDQKKTGTAIIIGGARDVGGFSNTIKEIIDGVSSNQNAAVQGFTSSPLKEGTEAFVKRIVDYIIKNHIKGNKLVIYGYSYGAMIALKVCRALNKLLEPIKVDLLITIDPASGKNTDKLDRSVSNNVVINFNFWQPRKDSYGSFGAPNEPINDPRIKNIDFTKNTIPGWFGTSLVGHREMDEISFDFSINVINAYIK
ncbi:MAG: hypothetical protein ACKVOW_20065, partial [Chitinophagaceae bacterium]